MTKNTRISIRITPNQQLVLEEMSEALDTSISMMIRTIIGSWIGEHEDQIYRIIDEKKVKKDALHQQNTEEEENRAD